MVGEEAKNETVYKPSQTKFTYHLASRRENASFTRSTTRGNFSLPNHVEGDGKLSGHIIWVFEELHDFCVPFGTLEFPGDDSDFVVSVH